MKELPLHETKIVTGGVCALCVGMFCVASVVAMPERLGWRAKLLTLSLAIGGAYTLYHLVNGERDVISEHPSDETIRQTFHLPSQ